MQKTRCSKVNVWKLFDRLSGHLVLKSCITVEERWNTLHERNKWCNSRCNDTEKKTRILDEAYPHTEVGVHSTGSRPGIQVWRDPPTCSLARSPLGIPSCGSRCCCRTSRSHVGDGTLVGRSALQGQQSTKKEMLDKIHDLHSFHILYRLVPELRITGVYWSLSQQSTSEGRVTTWISRQFIKGHKWTYRQITFICIAPFIRKMQPTVLDRKWK